MKRKSVVSRVFILLAVFAVFAFPGQSHAASSLILDALPSGAHLESQAAIEREPGYIGVTFLDPTPMVGLVRMAPDAPRLVWSHSLPNAGQLRASAGEPGVFIGSAEGSNSTRAELFAYSVTAGTVRSAIRGHPHGIVTGDQGVRFHSSGFSVLRRDTQHQGSIVYLDVSVYRWQAGNYVLSQEERRPKLAPSEYPRPNAVIKTRTNNVILLKLEVAATEASRETGLMNRTALDPDSGMIFVWDSVVHESFWMEDTFIPLSVAFVGSDGTIQEIQDMMPLTEDLHTPKAEYRYAIEVNIGFFDRAGVRAGDRVQLDLGS